MYKIVQIRSFFYYVCENTSFNVKFSKNWSLYAPSVPLKVYSEGNDRKKINRFFSRAQENERYFRSPWS